MLSASCLVIRGVCACVRCGRCRYPSATAAQPKPVRIAYLYSDGNIPGTLKAYKALLQERPDLRGQVQLTLPHRVDLSDVQRRRADGGRRARAGHHEPADARPLQRRAQDRSDRARARRAARCSRSAKGCCRRRPTRSRARSGTTAPARYWAHSGFANQVGLLKFALTQAGVTGLHGARAAAEPRLRLLLPGLAGPRTGLQRDSRDAGDGRSDSVFATWDEFDAWRQTTASSGPARRASPSASTSRPTTAARPSCSTR